MAGIKVDGKVPWIPFDQPPACPGGGRRKAIMEFRVLGPIELWSAGRPQDLGPARERCVLAILLLAPRTIVPAETLIDRLWDTRPPAKARESLSAYLARLRGSLRRAALLERVDCELALGRHATLVGELHHLLAQYPLDETFIAHQMTALYRSGRPGDALGLYRETRARLVEEQGTEPGPALSELHQRILRRDPELTGKPAARQPGRVSPPDTLPARVSRPDTLPARVSRPDTLPPETAEFVGRDEELSQLIGEEGDAPRVSVIVGVPGVGKTALAVHAARILAEI